MSDDEETGRWAVRGDESHESDETISPDEGGVGPEHPPPPSEPKDPHPREEDQSGS